ncbi:glycoside hydrolase family 88 protein [Butyrivibrio sp. INlla21]|uniref:glycoside hydrolase family 88 protein n=1 Tax=Butyrivibrio sp. INlla21 TaxID=1520811 RepID=UPI0008E5F2D0|nr:glycoside hydrolase family 88 protein [Butyrivibrio sp. INlla21]SFU66690.1 Rhamnogalacturonyl hydrolase YesR [Butyrivibrio sp. INlla21]
MENSAYFELVKVTANQLENIMNVSLSDRAKDTVKKVLGRSVRTKDPLFWPAGMLMLGLVSALEYLDAESVGEGNVTGSSDAGDLGADSPKTYADSARGLRKRIESVIGKHLDMWLSKYGGKIDYIDDALSGFCFIKMYERTRNTKYKDAADKLAEFIIKSPKDSAGSVIYNASRGNKNIFADGVGQVAMFAAEYIKVFGTGEDSSEGVESRHKAEQKKFVEGMRSVKDNLLKNFHTFGRDPKSGLIYHAYELQENVRYVIDGVNNEEQRRHTEFFAEKKGLMCWGRAFGWLIMGAAGAAASSSSAAAGPGAEGGIGATGAAASGSSGAFDVGDWFKELALATLDYQREDGGWSWQLQSVDGHIDMSATGMIAYALSVGLKSDIFSAEEQTKIKEAVQKASECMSHHIDGGAVLDALSSCDDFGVHYQTYGNYPWGQGAVLAAMSFAKAN